MVRRIAIILLVMATSCIAVVVAAAVILVRLSAPHPPAKALDLVGTYRAESWNGVHVLILEADGTYTQTIMVYSGEVLRNSGSWRYQINQESSGPHGAVILEHALIWPDALNRAFGRPDEARPGDWWLDADSNRWWYWGRVTLEWDPDSGVTFDKVR